MKLAILADIHSNFPALEAVFEDLQQIQVDEIIVVGDAINGAPFPCEVLALLRSQAVTLLLGNHEQYVLQVKSDHQHGLYESLRWGNVRWTAEQLDQTDVAFIQTWALEIERSGVLIMHGSPGNLFGGIQPNEADSVITERFGNVKHRWVVTAHTHRPFIRQWRDLTLINPGSVGMPLDRNPAACYAILTFTDESLMVTPRRVTYNTRLVKEAAYERGWLEAGGNISRLFLHEIMTGQPVLVEYLTRVQNAIDQQHLSEIEALSLVPLFG